MPFICGVCGSPLRREPLLIPARSARANPEPDFGSGTFRPALPRFTLAQGDCPGGVIPRGSTLVLVLPGGRGATPILHWGLPLDYRCDFGPEDYPPPGRPLLLVGPYAGVPVADYTDNTKVTVDIDAPGTVVAGSVLDYRIRMHVTGDVYLAVLGCPNYTERLGDITERHRLNCAAIDDFPERLQLGSRWFDMAMSVPATAPKGDQFLTWELDPPFRTATTTRSIRIL